MATWEDGPEYAPSQRPDAFTAPQAMPLEALNPAGPRPSGSLRTSGPQQPPVAFQPSADPGPELADLAPRPVDTRDPHQPFEVLQAATTAATSAWSSAHSSSVLTAPGTTAPAGPPPPDPTAPILLSSQRAHDAAALGAFPPPSGHAAFPPPSGAPAYPAPGTVQWFGPPSPDQGHPGRVPRLTVAEALTPGYMVVLALSLIYVLAPALLVIGVILANQVRTAQRQIQLLARGTLGLLAVIAVIALLTGPVDFSDWWGTVGVWSFVLSYALLAASIIVVLRQRSAANAPPPSQWG